MYIVYIINNKHQQELVKTLDLKWRLELNWKKFGYNRKGSDDGTSLKLLRAWAIAIVPLRFHRS